VVRVGRCPGGSTVGTTGVTSEHRCLVAVLKVVLKSGGRLRVGHRKRERLTGLRENRSERIRQSMVSDLVRYRRSRTEEIL
jgi:hypothetical protein